MLTITYLRFWCNHCKEFTLQNTNGGQSCRTCGEVTTSYKISDVPVEKLQAQRERYKVWNSKRNSILTLLEVANRQNLFLEDWNRPEIIEDDAGQKKIDEKRLKDYQKRCEEQEAENKRKKELKEKAKGLTRNDKCFCGSGIKFKNCCLNKL